MPTYCRVIEMRETNLNEKQCRILYNDPLLPSVFVCKYVVSVFFQYYHELENVYLLTLGLNPLIKITQYA